MKKIFTLSTIGILIAVLLTSCVKESPQNEDYWLSKERGVVVYSSTTCPFYVVETNNGYAVVRSVSGYQPWENDEVYGNFSNPGIRDIYDHNDRVVISGEIKDYWLSYEEANNELNYFCN